MHVEPVPGPVEERLRHEARRELVLARDPLHEPLEIERVVGRLQRVGDVQQVDLELPAAVLRDRAVDRHPVRVAGGIDVGEERLEMVEVVDRQRPVAVEELVGDRRLRRRRHLAGGVDEVELELGRHHRRQPEGRIARADRRQRPPRVAEIGPAVLAQHPERQERRRRAQPVHRQEAAPGRLAAPVDVALLVDERVAGDVLAPDVEAGDRVGHAHLALEHLGRLRHRHPLAAQDAIQVADRRAQAGDVGTALEPPQGVMGIQDFLRRYPRLLAFRRRAAKPGPARKPCNTVSSPGDIVASGHLNCRWRASGRPFASTRALALAIASAFSRRHSAALASPTALRVPPPWPG